MLDMYFIQECNNDTTYAHIQIHPSYYAYPTQIAALITTAQSVACPVGPSWSKTNN